MKLGHRKFGPASLRLARPSALPFHMRAEIAEVRELYVPPQSRRQGHATALLRQVIADADAARMLLLLAVDDGADQQALVTMYERHGFVPIQADPLLMVRPHAGMVNG